MIFLLTAFLLSLIGIIPLFVRGAMPAQARIKVAGALAVLYFLLGWLLSWLAMPSMAYPLPVGVVVLVLGVHGFERFY